MGGGENFGNLPGRGEGFLRVFGIHPDFRLENTPLPRAKSGAGFWAGLGPEPNANGPKTESKWLGSPARVIWTQLFVRSH